MNIRLIRLFLIVFALSACNSAPPNCMPIAGQDVVYVVSHGWHAELGIPVDELGQNLAFYGDIFQGAQTIMFGYGKETFFTAPPDTWGEYFLGPFPGPAVIQVVGLNVSPLEAYLPDDTVTLTLPPGGRERLSAYISNDLIKNTAGEPTLVAHSTNPDGLFYAAKSEYTLLHTCNAWTSLALEEAGLPISANNVVFSGQVMARVSDAHENQCQLLR